MSGAVWREGGFGLYVHWPFCASKCPYCDFNSHVAETVDHARWRAALVAEVQRVAARVPGRVLQSIFFGGGTPSLMAPETVAAVIDAARGAWVPANDLEVTLEANPTSVEAGRFRAFAEAGVNRVSLGVQALHDDALRRLGRMHDRAAAVAAVETAQSVFGRVSFDLIYARQDQDRAAWRRELREALALAADHLSLYQLTIEPGTVFGARHARGLLRGLPGEDLAADLYWDTQEACEAAGLPAYEVSNHARPGAESRHNLVYWRQGDWAAVGPGAHGRLTVGGQRHATEAAVQPGAWLAAVAGGSGDVIDDVLTPEDQAAEFLLMGLRLTEGIDLHRLAEIGPPLPEAAIAELVAEGMLRRDAGRLAATAQGRVLLNPLLGRLLA